MKGIGGSDEIEGLPLQLRHESPAEIPLIQLRLRHFGRSRFQHPGGKILPEDHAALLIQPRRQRARAKADIQHPGRLSGQHPLIDAAQQFFIAREGIAALLVRQADGLVVPVRPKIEAL